MTRYFLEFSYKGTAFHGLQLQPEGITIQGEINKALGIILKQEVQTTVSSRTDAGVHAKQNFVHLDLEQAWNPKLLYNANAIIHPDIVLKHMIAVEPDQHARFDAVARSYSYHIITHKNPFLRDFAYYFPFALDRLKMEEATKLLFEYHDFESFSKKHTDVHTFQCTLSEARWEFLPAEIVFHVTSNRFLRGMVRALVATLLLVGRRKISIPEFKDIIERKDCTLADFSAEAKGLFLEKVHYPFI